MPTPKTNNLREYWDAALKFSELEVECFLIGDTGLLVSPSALNQLRHLTESQIKAILNDEIVPGVGDINLKSGLKKFREKFETEQEFINELKIFKIKLNDALHVFGANKTWNLDPRINTKAALQEAKDPEKFDGIMSRLFNEWPREHFQNLEGMETKFCGLIKNIVKEVEVNKQIDPEIRGAVKSGPVDAAQLNELLESAPALKQKMQSFCTNMALQGLRNFCGTDGISPDIRDMFQLSDIAGGEISEDKQLIILRKFLEGYVGLIAEPNKQKMEQEFDPDKDKQEIAILDSGFVSSEINQYLKGDILKQQLPYLLSLIKFEKQLELSKQQLGENNPVYKSSQQLLDQCHKECRLLLEDPKNNKAHLDELKKVMDSGARILKDPQSAKKVDKVDQFVETAAHVKKHEIKAKCYQFASSVCGLMGKKEKQVKYTQKARDSLHGIQIYHGQLFSDSANKKQPAVKAVEQTRSMKEKIQNTLRRFR